MKENSLKILLPLYIYPNWYDGENYIWQNVTLAAQQVPIVAIINPNNGTGGQPPNTDYAKGLADLRQAKIKILGYVYTQYGDRNLAEVQQDIAIYNNYYNLDGIFLDESASNSQKVAYYQEIYRYIKNQTKLKQVVINPGTYTDEIYLARPATDTIVIFENYPQEWLKYQPQSYVTNYSNHHFASLIHSVNDLKQMKSYIKQAITYNIGYIYVTDDSPDNSDRNPWNSLPSYWQEEVDYIQFLNNSH